MQDARTDGVSGREDATERDGLGTLRARARKARKEKGVRGRLLAMIVACPVVACLLAAAAQVGSGARTPAALQVPAAIGGEESAPVSLAEASSSTSPELSPEKTPGKSPERTIGKSVTPAPDRAIAPAPTGTRAGDDPISLQRAAARAGAVQRLLSLAKWCSESELFLERDKVWTGVIKLDPDNQEARKGLRYSRSAEGVWREPAPREVKNRNPKALEEFPARRTEAIAPFCEAMFALLDKEKGDSSLKSSIYEDILALDPDDARVHTDLGEVKDDGKWCLSETAAGKKQRPEIKANVKSALEADAHFEPAEADAADAALAAWKCGVKTASMRVLGTGDAAACEIMARTCTAAGGLLSALFGAEMKFPRDFAIYLATAAGEREAFIEKIPIASAEERAFLEAIPGGGVPNTNKIVLFEAEAKRRMDCAVRNTIGHLLHENFRVTSHCGWVWEGAGSYLTRELVGTRLTWYILIPPGKDKLRSSLIAPESNWMNEALKILDSPGAPRLDDVMKRDVTAMGIPEMLASYALAAYVLEGRPERAADLFTRAGAGEDPAAAVEASLGIPIGELQERLKRWLKERR